MAEPQLSVRSKRALELAHVLASRERRTIAQVVECALELYARQELARETAAEFSARLARAVADDRGTENEDRRPPLTLHTVSVGGISTWPREEIYGDESR